ncbi:hypothetical protein ACVWXU_003837 [Streptomyces sp. TE33382]
MPAAVVRWGLWDCLLVSACQMSLASRFGVSTDSAFSELRLRPTRVAPASRTPAFAAAACAPR